MFLRPSGGASSGNVLERNDTSYANNNCIEAQCAGQYLSPKQGQPRQPRHLDRPFQRVDRRGQRVLLQRRAQRVSQRAVDVQVRAGGPQHGAGGIIILGWCNHTICRGNKCIGNNGAGICLAINASPTQPNRVFHWIMENNIIRDNRWGIYLEMTDWIDMAGNVMENNRDGNMIQGGINTNITIHPDDPKITRPPKAKLVPPAEARPGELTPVKTGQDLVFDASGSSDPDGHPLTFRWNFNDGTTAAGPRVTHAFQKIGPRSVGVTVTNGRYSDLAYCSFLAYDDVAEPATEGHAADWSWEELRGRDYQWHVPRGMKPSNAPITVVAKPQTKVEISDDRRSAWWATSRWPSASRRPAKPPSACSIRAKNAGIPLAGKTSLDFWVKMLNNNVHAWKGFMPTVVIYESPTKFCQLRPNDDPLNWQGGTDWIHKSVPLGGNEVWQIEGAVPATMNWMTIEFFPWGGAPFQVWLDGMTVK